MNPTAADCLLIRCLILIRFSRDARQGTVRFRFRFSVSHNFTFSESDPLFPTEKNGAKFQNNFQLGSALAGC